MSFFKKQSEKTGETFLNKMGREFAITCPPPKTNEYKTISTLLDDVERWRNIGDKELEKKTWQMISEKASLYADGMRESYEVYSQCGVVRPNTNTQIEQ